MADMSADAALAAKQAQDGELLALKQQVDRLKGDLTPGQNKQQKLRKACTDFEAVFITKMWEQMRATIPKGGMLNSPQEDMYRSMFDRDFAEKLAGDGGIGLGDMLYGQLKDKLKGVTKIPGKTGSESLQGASASGAVPAAAPHSLPLQQAKPELKQPKRPLGGEISSAAPASTTATAPARPASVPGEVMADVEALARRIEADYDRRQAQAAVGQSVNVQAAAAQPQAADAVSQAQAAGYGINYGTRGRVSAQNPGRIIAKVG